MTGAPRPPSGRTRDAATVFAVALAVRLAVVAWAAARIPAAADGVYYDKIATRIAAGLGYTWLWPDGAVTYAAHYPIGYPAILGAAYAVFGSHVVVAMLVNTVLGAVGALAAHAALVRSASPRAALFGGLAVAIHPALALYTPALMTEGATATFVTLALYFATRASSEQRAAGWRVATGVALGVATLVRPQCIVFAPALGLLAAGGVSVVKRVSSAALVTAVAVACCLPWTARNCVRMDRCALVSVNGGWNLLIGAQTTTGAWAPVDVPAECREVWAEAAKDDCFGRVARTRIGESPVPFFAGATRKIAVTFDYFGGAPWYLHDANGDAFPDRAKVVSGAVEAVVSRLLLVAALVALARRAGPYRRVRFGLAALGIAFACMVHGWPAYAILAVLTLVRPPSLLAREAPLVPFTGMLILATMATHAAFFGAGRYGLVVVPFVTLVAFVSASPRPHEVVTSA